MLLRLVCGLLAVATLLPALTGCPSRSGAGAVSTTFAGKDNGATIPDWLGAPGETCHKLVPADFPVGWPAGLQVPGNCYTAHAGELIQAQDRGNPDGHSTLRLFLDINAPQADLRRFYEEQFRQLGSLEPTKSRTEAAVQSVSCTPRNPKFSRYRVIVSRRPNDPEWSTLLFDAVLK